MVIGVTVPSCLPWCVMLNHGTAEVLPKEHCPWFWYMEEVSGVSHSSSHSLAERCEFLWCNGESKLCAAPFSYLYLRLLPTDTNTHHTHCCWLPRRSSPGLGGSPQTWRLRALGYIVAASVKSRLNRRILKTEATKQTSEQTTPQPPTNQP